MPKFSIIVPVYNVEDFIDECVESVVNQSFVDWELLLIDDGSSDSSADKCDLWSQKDERIKSIHQKNGGASMARNNGLSNCTGDYILFLDSDDFWNTENALSLLDNKINQSSADVVIFGCTDFNMITNEIVVSRTNYNLELIDKGDKNDTLHYLLSNKLLPGGPTIFCFSKNAADDNNVRFKIGIQDEDYDFVMSVFLNCKSIFAINDPFYMYRKGRASSVTGSSNIKMIEGIAYTVEKWVDICNFVNNDIIKKDLLNYVAFIYSTGFVICGRMDRKTRKKAISIMKKYKYVLNYAYWIKPRISKLAVNLMGFNLFSILSSKYFKMTHI